MLNISKQIKKIYQYKIKPRNHKKARVETLSMKNAVAVMRTRR